MATSVYSLNFLSRFPMVIDEFLQEAHCFFTTLQILHLFHLLTLLMFLDHLPIRISLAYLVLLGTHESAADIIVVKNL